jgi:hypothetical protein
VNPDISVTLGKLSDILLAVAIKRPVFIWGAPGIGKSAAVESFAIDLGLPCVSLLGSQLAPEDIIGVPQISDGKSFFCPPRNIARDEPYVLFLDELNACSQEVQKAFYSLIHDRRIGEYALHEQSIVIGAGNRSHDNAIVKQMSSALMNRMIHVHVKASHREWLEWAGSNGVHSAVLEYIALRPDHLWSAPPKTEQTFSTPRSWHALSDAMNAYGDALDDDTLRILTNGSLSPEHAGLFCGFIKQTRNKHFLASVLKDEATWPRKPEDRDLLHFLCMGFRSHLIKELPESGASLTDTQKKLVVRAKAMLKDLASISEEMTKMVVMADDDMALPNWFQVEIARDLPRILVREKQNAKV